MDNNEWDDSLKNLLGNHKPEGMQPDWDAFSHYMNEHDFLEELGEDADFDENLRHELSAYEAPGKPKGWERIESTLTDDVFFDKVVRDRVHQFKPQYDPRTWPLFLSRLSGAGYLRAKLIAFKVVEVAAVFLLLFTVVKMGQMGKLPFDTPLYERSSDQPGSNETSPGDRTDNTINSENAPSHPSSSTDQLASSENNDGDLSEKQLNSTSNRNSTSFSSPAKKQKIQANTHQALTTNPSSVNHDAISNKDEIRTIHPAEISHTTTGSTSIPVEINPFISNSSTNEPAGVATDHFNAAISNNELNDAAMEGFEADHVIHDFSATDLIATSISPVDWNDHLYLPKPKYVKKKVGTYTEFGIVSQMDYNRMRMPEDKLYSAGRQVVFPQKGLLSTSLGSGFTIALGHPRWAIETGLIYSSKKFNPGRQLVVGSAFDRGSVEFKTMNLQLVSLPLQFRYRIDHKGSFRFYSLAGFEIHLITKSDIDVLIKYDFASAAAGVDPNNDPKFANVIQETRRISEHIRDGAPLSTKSFLSLNAGLGCEYSLSGQKTLFLQSAVQYQVPNVKFSNNNGKNIRSISIQGGVRMPIGK